MRYSFIKPHPRPLVSLFTKIWVIFILFVSLIMISFGLFLLFQIYNYQKEAVIVHNKRVAIESKVDKMDRYIEYLLRQKAQGEEIYSRNTLLKDSIKNLFDLVPNQITLKRVIIKKDSLIIYGKTPTKDAYNFLLAAPLKSIFSTNNTMFYLSKSGWYNFISTNKITQTDGFSE